MDPLVVVLVVGIGLVAAIVAVVVNGRARRPLGVTFGEAPSRVDRADLPHAEVDVLVVLFSSRTCDACGAIAQLLPELDGPGVATAEVSWQERRDLHQRYAIPAVPTTLVVSRDGTVTWSAVGAVDRSELEAAIGRVS
jgi:hypothetical protein